jgi:hypothetical protein
MNMLNRKHVTMLLIMVMLAALPHAVQAGQAYFYSQITYDPGWGTVYGYSETYYDYSTAYYYYGCTVVSGYKSNRLSWL